MVKSPHAALGMLQANRNESYDSEDRELQVRTGSGDACLEFSLTRCRDRVVCMVLEVENPGLEVQKRTTTRLSVSFDALEEEPRVYFESMKAKGPPSSGFAANVTAVIDGDSKSFMRLCP